MTLAFFKTAEEAAQDQPAIVLFDAYQLTLCRSLRRFASDTCACSVPERIGIAKRAMDAQKDSEQGVDHWGNRRCLNEKEQQPERLE
jgi:hypothetical protein